MIYFILEHGAIVTTRPYMFGIPLPPGFELEWDPDRLLVRCGRCGEETYYSTAGYRVSAVQADALNHRACCHPDASDA